MPKLDISEEEAIKEVLNLTKEAVRIRLQSDVPLGAFLSGGIDSSTVVALMSEVSLKKVKTFSIGFQESSFSELQYARSIARHFDTEHHEFIVKPDALGILPLLVERYGEPYADSSCIPTYYVSQQTKQFVTVALNGDGGDESFAGYERYQAMKLAAHFDSFSSVGRAGMRILKQFLPDSPNPKNSLRRLKRFFEGALLPSERRYLRWVGIFNEESKSRLYSDDFRHRIANDDSLFLISPYLNQAGLDLVDRLLLADTCTYLPFDLLVKVDIASMACALETRSPFLDHKLMEFVARLPVSYKINRGVKKYILKKAIKNLIPPENIHRRKMGFGLPIGDWFRHELKGFLQDTVLSQAALRRGYFNPAAVNNLIGEHCSGRKDYTLQLWSLLMLELWHKRFID